MNFTANLVEPIISVFDERIESDHIWIICGLEIHVTHNAFGGASVQIDGSFVIFENYLGRTYIHNLHSAELITSIDFQHIIIDQEHVHDLCDVGISSSEHSIHIAGEYWNIIFSTDVCGVSIYITG